MAVRLYMIFSSLLSTKKVFLALYRRLLHFDFLILHWTREHHEVINVCFRRRGNLAFSEFFEASVRPVTESKLPMGDLDCSAFYFFLRSYIITVKVIFSSGHRRFISKYTTACSPSFRRVIFFFLMCFDQQK